MDKVDWVVVPLIFLIRIRVTIRIRRRRDDGGREVAWKMEKGLLSRFCRVRTGFLSPVLSKMRKRPLLVLLNVKKIQPRKVF